MKKVFEIIKAHLPLAILIGANAYYLSKCVYYVDGGFHAIKFSRIYGLRPECYREGWHFMLPYFERPIIYDMRTQAIIVTSKTGSKDLQTVDITVRLLHRPMANRLTELYRYLGTNYSKRVLPSIVNEVVKIIVV